MPPSAAVASITYGVEIIYGLMGAGKSYYATRRCVREVLESRRPLYTNLPLKFPVVRRYLTNRGGPTVTNLIRRLDEKHWRRFLKRQHDFARFRESLKKSAPADLEPADLEDLARAVGRPAEHLATLPKIYDRHLAAWFCHRNGQHVTDGPDANWIPPTAIIALDEVQHWHPMTRQKDDPSREDLLAYLTMIRHHCHTLWAITQDPSRIAIEFRRLARYYWRVWDRSEDRLAWGIRYKHFGIKAMGYECSTIDQIESRDRDNGSHVERFTIVPAFPWNKPIFRLYSSHTNIGSARQIARELRKAREMAGLDETGKTQSEIDMATAAPPKPGIVRRTIRLSTKAAVLTIVATAAYSAGSYFKPAPPPPETNTDEQRPPLNWPRWSGAGSSPWIDRRRVNEGEWINDRVRLDHVDPGGRRLVLRVDDDEWWLWTWPDPQPIRVGTVDDIRAAVARLNDPTREPSSALP